MKRQEGLRGKCCDWKGEFLDEGMEQAYMEDRFLKTVPYVRPTVLLLGLLNLSFIIPDYYEIQSAKAFAAVAANRLVFALAMAVFYLWTRDLKRHDRYHKGIWAIEMMTVLLFLHVYRVYDPADFIIQILGMITLMTALAVIGNRWLYSIAANLFLITGFFWVTLRFDKAPEGEWVLAALIYSAIIFGLLSMSSLQANRFQRDRFGDRKDLEELSATDPLTRVANRWKFEASLREALERNRRYGNPFSVAMFDIDDFKTVNDTLGHVAGDRVLVKLAETVASQLRSTDLLARWGGEEFVILMEETDIGEAAGGIDRIRDRIEQTRFEGSRLTCTFGIAQARRGDRSVDLVDRADRLLYQGKREGKNKALYDCGQATA